MYLCFSNFETEYNLDLSFGLHMKSPLGYTWKNLESLLTCARAVTNFFLNLLVQINESLNDF